MTPAAPEDLDYVRVIPLGGLDQFGMNCCIIECNQRMLLFDCGLSFPDNPGFGIDYILPDWSWVLDNMDRLEGIVLTHGHEDHIGAVPFLLEELDIPVWSGQLTIAMLQRKLIEADIEDVPYNVVEPRDRVEIGPFTLEFIHVNHSIPNAMSVAIHTPVGTLLFTGDWKLDQTPVGEPVMDLQSFARLGEDGVLALLGDSTNVTTPGFSTSERVVLDTIEELLVQAEGRVFVAQFSSNMLRLGGIIEAAARTGRKVCLLGRSLERNFKLAAEFGYIKPSEEDVIIDPSDAESLPDERVVVVSTGSQAEPRSSMTRMAFGDHHLITLRSTDTVIMSARMIPGNERGIYRMLDELSRKGVTIITQRDADVHGSGHGHVEELKLLLNLVRPKYLVPMHGEFRVRSAHATLGTRVGAGAMPMLINDGDILEFTGEGARVVGRVPSGRVAVDGKFMGDIDDVQLRDRRRLAATGIIVAFAVVDRSSGEIVNGPDLMHHGFLAGVPESDTLLAEAQQFAADALGEMPRHTRKDSAEVAEVMRIHVRRYFRKKLNRKPVVVPIVHEL